MTKDELNKLTLNQRVKKLHINKFFECTFIYGYVLKIYNGNQQLKVWFDGEPKARVLGYTQIDIVD